MKCEVVQKSKHGQGAGKSREGEAWGAIRMHYTQIFNCLTTKLGTKIKL